jgi:hypothetical protein
MIEATVMEKFLYTKREWPAWVHAIFPAIFLFYKKTKPKERRRGGGGFTPVSIIRQPGRPVKYKYKEVKKAFKNKNTREQNVFSYVSAVLQSPDGYGTVQRSLKHKGFSRLIAVFYATDEEVNSVKDCWRYHFTKYKAIKEFYTSRPINDPRFKAICDELAVRYPSSASQLQLFK